jgi:hypothetical protein
MKRALTLLTALLVGPLASFAQAKLEVAEANKAAKRARESAPAEKRALWEQQREPAPERGLGVRSWMCRKAGLECGCFVFD